MRPFKVKLEFLTIIRFKERKMKMEVNNKLPPTQFDLSSCDISHIDVRHNFVPPTC